MVQKICVAGAGTMGSGIALAAALTNLPVILFDINEQVIVKAKELIDANLAFFVGKKKMTAAQAHAATAHILFTSGIQQCQADVVIEAIIEKAEAKASLLHQLAAINTAETIFASNTSSLSITAIQENIPHPERVAGMHFFNPAHVMKLVEVVKGKQTTDAVAETLMQLCVRMKKTPVLCTDSPGFIVNRVARHYYLEALKLVEGKVASVEEVDIAMEACGFKMGPFKLMDLIGMDINYAVSESVYVAFDQAIRFKPSVLQKEKVEKAELGKKTGKGFYDYKPKA